LDFLGFQKAKNLGISKQCSSPEQNMHTLTLALYFILPTYFFCKESWQKHMHVQRIQM